MACRSPVAGCLRLPPKTSGNMSTRINRASSTPAKPRYPPARRRRGAFQPVRGGQVFEIAPENLRQYVNQDQPGVFRPREAALPSGPAPAWCFPAGSVTAVELDVQVG